MPRTGRRWKHGISVEVRRPAKNDTEQREWITTLYDPLSQFDLPAGRYEVVIGVGYAKRVFPVDVKSGDTTRVNFNHRSRRPERQWAGRQHD